MTPSVACAICGSTVEQTGRGRPRKYCSATCAKTADNLATRAWRARGERPRFDACFAACVVCGEMFSQAPGRTRKYCDNTCSVRDRHGYSLTPCVDCGVPRERALGQRCVECAATRRANKNWHRRVGNRQVHIDRLALLASHGGECGICSEAIDEALTWPHPLSLSVDHVMPLARGGSHSVDNVQPAHLRCNLRKGARVA